MQELVGRLSALDPEATETLKVITYFDTLLAGGVGIEALVRGAAVLAGVPAGFAAGSRTVRVDPAGRRVAANEGAEATWPARETGGGTVWIERVAAAHANDQMVLERLAMAVGITVSRDGGLDHGATETAIDHDIDRDERAKALARLHVDAQQTVRIVALPASAADPRFGPSAVVATPWGLVRAIVVVDAAAAVTGRAGIGLAVEAIRLPTSWRSAILALRLAGADPVDAGALGASMLLVEAADALPEPHPDVAALESLADRPGALDALDALAETGSVRSAALRLGVHHSTLQTKVASLSARLGYDPRTPAGRTRYTLARTLLTAGRAHFS
ncbi:LysR family transcriptional regulator [Leifsonia poae]|uniref:LysR family transcriptional regulator n=1 Tax=Leifsonia poae TaxID=110933 RepID=UPI001CBEE6BD|nr:LysR family transcriptional regulator [Leifsonia poae]